MTALKNQAISMIYDIPNEQMNHVIEILNGLNKIIVNTTGSSASLDKKANRLEIWNDFKKYKGIIPCGLSEKAELARARDEKYADFI